MILSSEVSGLFHQIAAGSAAGLGGFVSATVYGWLDPIFPYLLSPESEIQMTSEEASWMTVMPDFGNIISPIPAGFLADHFGRKALILSTAPIYLFGWTIILYFKSLLILNIARFIQGLSMGIAFTVIPVYLGEIASTKSRGAITSIFFALWWAGFLFEYSIGPYFSFVNFTYITASANIVFFLLFLWQPESPYYYLMKNEVGKARSSLEWLQQTSEDKITRELENMKRCVEDDRMNKVGWHDLITSSTDRKALLILFFVGFLRQCNGLIALSLYSTETLEAAGDQTFLSVDNVTMAMGWMMLIGSIGGVFTLDLFGRKPLLFWSSLISGLSMFAAGTYYYLKFHSTLDISEYNWVPPVSFLVLALTTVMGIFPVNTAYSSELFTSNTRSLASGLFTIYTTSVGIFVLKYYPTLFNVSGPYLNFYLCTFVGLLGTVFTYIGMPETKGKTFQQIRLELSCKRDVSE